jgi:DNA mismatch repair protein MutS2
MDEKSLEILEFPQIRRIVAGYSSFPVGTELILNLMPLSDYEQVVLLLKQSEEAQYLLSVDREFSTGGASDIREMVRMAALGKILDPLNLNEIQQTLAVMRQAHDKLSRISDEVPLLWRIAKDIKELPEVEGEIIHCISKGGEVLDRASPRLESVRRRLRETRQALRERLETIIKEPKVQKIIQEPIITEREGRYVIPVKNELRREIEGITHDVSNTGATVFVEPWVTIELGNTIRELVTEEKYEIEKILQHLSMTVGTYDTEILTGISRLAELDVALAKAKYARAVKASVPELVSFSNALTKDSPVAFIRLVEARHPLLGKKAVPLSVEVGRDYSVLVITGPNTGGKTVALKTIGLMSLMAQAGIPIPAAPETRLPVFGGIFADIGDEQSIEHTLSSFSWHIGNIVRIIKNATSSSLVLLDELGTSTDPTEGSALARAVLLHFLSSGVMTVATTHYSDLKVFAHQTPGMQNASFDFDPVTLAPTYRLTLGIPGGSNALATAARLGIPPGIINEAKKMITEGALDLNTTLSDIMAEKEKIIETRESLEKERKEAKSRNNELESRLEQLKEMEKRTIQEVRDRVVNEAAELNREIRKASSELRKNKTKETVAQAKKTLTEVQSSLHSKVWSPEIVPAEDENTVSAGDTVYLRDIDLHGIVLSVSKETGEVEVQAGQIKIRVGVNSIEKSQGRPVSRSGVSEKIVIPEIAYVPAELDLRGKRASEIEVALDSYLNSAALTNLREVVIIHGLATGTVRQIVRDILAVHPLVKSYRPGKQGEGGDGVTVVSF